MANLIRVPLFQIEMQLTLTGEYAVRAMIHLASVPPGELAQISDISARWDIPENFLRKIIPSLTRSGMIASRRGNGGGVSLAKPAESITLLDVIEAVEGPMYLNKCLIGPEFCNRTAWCVVHCVWSDAQDTLKGILRSKSIAELVAAGPAAVAHPATFAGAENDPVTTIRTL
jgi:Rrf2 family transcriptional regulator, iron-sulfur cluster assembly transcription factor